MNVHATRWLRDGGTTHFAVSIVELVTMLSSSFLRTANRSVLRHSSKSYAFPEVRVAFFSSGSHDDFAPKRKNVEGEEEAIRLIKEHVESNPIMLYMKGNPSMPMCGFSARVVGVLQEEGVDFSSVNVLDYPDIREGVKKFSCVRSERSC